MVDFVDWVVREEDLLPGNRLRAGLLEASDVLNEQMITLRIIQPQKTDTNWWKSIDILPGVGITLANKVKSYEKYLKTRRSNEEAVDRGLNRAIEGVSSKLNPLLLLIIPTFALAR